MCDESFLVLKLNKVYLLLIIINEDSEDLIMNVS